MQLNRKEKQQFNKVLDTVEDLRLALPKMNREQKEQALDFIDKQIPFLAQHDFYTYLRYVVDIVIPAKYIDGVHIHFYCQELEKVEREIAKGKFPKLQFALPPGAMKSVTLAIFVSWVFGRHPDWRVIHVGHGKEFAISNFAIPIRDILEHPKYAKIFPETEIRKDSRSKKGWKFTKGGTYIAVGAGESIAGQRGHLLICDDVLSEQTAASDTETDKINRWYGPGLRTRGLASGFGEIIVMTRWRVDDLAGFVQEVDQKSDHKWRIISIPAILDEKAAKLLKLPEGGSFWPEFQDYDFLMDKKATNTPAKWQALYMQSPVLEEGNIYKKSHFAQRWDPDEDGELRFRSIIISFDTAFSTAKTADYSAYTVWGIFDKRGIDADGRPYSVASLCLLDLDKGHWDFVELTERLRSVYGKYVQSQATVHIVVENKASGQSVIQTLRKQGLPIHAFNPDKDKKARAFASTPYFDTGLVWFYTDDCYDYDINLYFQELLEFPASKKKDFVDSTSQAVIFCQKNTNIKTNDIREYLDEDEDRVYNKPRRTYWSSLRGKRHG